ncbi:MAG: hypothetical protein L3J43_04980 [Sulfurovum sp.]|nr:hypothetical protein [Sulfurovum sp.]
MSKIIFAISDETEAALIDLLSSKKRGGIREGILTALEYYFSQESIKNNPDFMYKNILTSDVKNALKNGEDLVSVALEYTDAKRVKKFREEKEKKRRKREKKNGIKKGHESLDGNQKIEESELTPEEIIRREEEEIEMELFGYIKGKE